MDSLISILNQVSHLKFSPKIIWFYGDEIDSSPIKEEEEGFIQIINNL